MHFFASRQDEFAAWISQRAKETLMIGGIAH